MVTDVSRKVGAVTANHAMLPRNVLKWWQFWNMPFPYGIANINRNDLIDINEAAIFLETVGRRYGKCFVGKRVCGTGPYGHSEKWTLTMAISGSPQGEQWVDFVHKSGMTTANFLTFIRRILNSIPPGNTGRRRVFIMDNLSSHQNVVIRQLIHSYGHRLVFRALYYPVDGPIEFVFNCIEQQLKGFLYAVKTQADLQTAVY